jgi:transcriptional regulator with XRE-family HTH domain
MTQQALAELTGLKQQTIQKLETRKSKKSQYVDILAKALQVSTNWLLTGQGPLHPPPEEQLAPRRRALIELFESLTKDQQDEIWRELEETKQRNETIFEALSRKKAERGAKV